MQSQGISENKPQTQLNEQVIWRRNSPYLYQLLYVTELEWPSLTVEWVSAYKSEKNSISDDIETPYNLILGTHTSNEESNYVMVAKVRIPNQDLLRKKYENGRPGKSEMVKKNDEAMGQKVQILACIPHEGEVNRVRHNPHEYTKIATQTKIGQIHLFSTSHKKENKLPELRLVGQSKAEAYALEWNANKNWHIAGGNYDGKLSIWDCNKKQQQNQVSPLLNLHYHKSEVEDISYNKMHDSVLASCDDQGVTAFWDTRDCCKTPILHFECHEKPQNCIQFSVSNQYNFATCGDDTLIKVWDMRNWRGPLLVGQDNAEVKQVQWSREDPTTLWAVSGSTASLWDMSQEKPIFRHCGHQQQVSPGCLNSINELSVNINQADTIATVDINNELHIFQPNANCKHT